MCMPVCVCSRMCACVSERHVCVEVWSRCVIAAWLLTTHFPPSTEALSQLSWRSYGQLAQLLRGFLVPAFCGSELQASSHCSLVLGIWALVSCLVARALPAKSLPRSASGSYLYMGGPSLLAFPRNVKQLFLKSGVIFWILILAAYS